MRRNSVGEQGFCICLLNINEDSGIRRVMSPRLFQKDGNISSLNRNFKICRGMIEAASTFHYFKLVFFPFMFRIFFLPTQIFLPGHELQIM